MKAINYIFVISLLVLSIIITSGCSSNNQRNYPQRGNFQDMTEEERQQMFEERQQKMIDACEGKDEGDVCTIESPRGETEGTCEIIDNNLICTMDMPMGQPPEQR